MKDLLEMLLPSIILLITSLAIAFGAVYFVSTQEAKTFNRCTGSNVTTFEAMFAEFRIENCTK